MIVVLQLPALVFLALFFCVQYPAAVSAIQVDESELDRQVREVSKKLRCTVCQSESVWESNAPLAKQMRALVRERLEGGEPPESVLLYFQSRYGDYILLAPRRSGLNWLIWIGPFVLLAFGSLLLFRILSKSVKDSKDADQGDLSPLDEHQRHRVDEALRRRESDD